MGKSTRYGISVDNQPAIIANNDAWEFSKTWEDKVFQNEAVMVAKFLVWQSTKVYAYMDL